MNKETPNIDRELTQEEKILIAQLSPKEIEEIEMALLSNIKNNWNKVAMVIGMTMGDLPDNLKGLPDVFFSKIIRKLAKDGHLESKGNLYYMRFSEVRLANTDN